MDIHKNALMMSHAFLRKAHGECTNHLFPRWNFLYYFIVPLLSVIAFCNFFLECDYKARGILYATNIRLSWIRLF